MPWKLYIDSRKRVKGARGDSDSSFSVALPYPITVSGKAYVDVVLLGNTFSTIRTGDNDRIYMDEGVAQNPRIVQIAAGQYSVYTLRDAMVTALNSNPNTVVLHHLLEHHLLELLLVHAVHSVTCCNGKYVVTS